MVAFLYENCESRGLSIYCEALLHILVRGRQTRLRECVRLANASHPLRQVFRDSDDFTNLSERFLRFLGLCLTDAVCLCFCERAQPLT